jgi:hypothetical protein
MSHTTFPPMDVVFAPVGRCVNLRGSGSACCSVAVFALPFVCGDRVKSAHCCSRGRRSELVCSGC